MLLLLFNMGRSVAEKRESERDGKWENDDDDVKLNQNCQNTLVHVWCVLPWVFDHHIHR